MFKTSLQKAESSNYLDQRIEHVVKQMNEIIYNNVCRGLFERDKIMFSFILAVSLLQAKEKLDFKLFNFFIQPLDTSSLVRMESKIQWLNDSTWQKVVMASGVQALKQFVLSLTSKTAQWENLYMEKNPENMTLPEPFENCSNLERMMIFKILRPDIMPRIIRKFISEELGEEYTRSPPFDIEKSFRESAHSLPLVF